MKIHRLIRNVPGRLAAIASVALGAASTAGAAAALQGQLVLRPLTPGEISNYKLPSSTEVSGGLSAVGVGQPVYLEADVNIEIPASDITGVTWQLTGKPAGSMLSATLPPSPLGNTIPVYEPADRLISQVAGRALLRPDMAGQYTVEATINTASSGTTNISTTITASTYGGYDQTCQLCHSGGKVAPDKSSWVNTAHAHIFTEGIDGELGHYAESCLKCHTVGYDTNTNAVNGGFDDIAAKDNWIFPTVQTNGNWDAMPADLKNVSNIQCENCHGPGYQHALVALQNHDAAKQSIAVSLSSGACNQCHDAPTHHIKGTEWYSSLHAVTTRRPSGPGEESCVGCHTGAGFIARMNGVPESERPTDYVPINCQACHEPHGDTDPTNNVHLIRTLASVTFEDSTVVTNGGSGLLCMECHHARVDAKTYATSYHSRFGPHHGPQGDMLEGVNGFTYDQDIPSSAHRNAVGDTCVTCHMQNIATTDPAFLKAGGHTFKMDVESTNAPDLDLVAACQNCHGSTVTSFDFALQDYDGDGVIDGVQTEVQHLLDKLALLLPPEGQPKTTVTPTSTWTAPQLEAAYNYLFVQEDGSMGIHNTAYAVGLLKTSIANLTGDANSDSLPDAWQVQYFGSATNPNAAPNANPSGDGVPNWAKYALGLDPTVAGTVLPNGVVFANGKGLVNPPVDPGATNQIEIFTAAEVSFNTEVGKTYQIQSVSELSGGWANVGDPIPGTGSPLSYVTPTRGNAQLFYRVVHN